MAKPTSPRSRQAPLMENYRKVRFEEAPGGVGTEWGGLSPDPFADLAPGAVHVRVKEGSKIRNLLAFAISSMAQPATRAIVFSGCGRATTKTVTCAEILKRRLAGLHQVTRLRYRSVCEVWQSPRQGPLLGLANRAPVSVFLRTCPASPSYFPRMHWIRTNPATHSPNPHSGPLSQPTRATSKRSLGEPAAGEGSAKRPQPEPGAAEEDWKA